MSVERDRGGSPETTGTVVITGGTSGLGAAVARHLVAERGVRSLILASRRGTDAPGAAQLASELAESGAMVEVRTCDVADRDSVAQLLATIPEEAPLSGIVHAAATLDDGVITALTPERLDAVLAAKADGAWHLHELTRGRHDLAFFVLFSSAAGTLGSPGQANYASANAFLDALAAHRHAVGLAATSIAWGPWQSTTDMTVRLDQADFSRLARAGVIAMPDRDGLALFDAIIAEQCPTVLAAHLHRPTLIEQARAAQLPALLSELVPAPRRISMPGFERELARVPESERAPLVLDLVRGQIAFVLGHDEPNEIDADQNFQELGFDSLTAVETRNRLAAATGLTLPATLVFDYPTPAAVAGHIRQLLNSDGLSIHERHAFDGLDAIEEYLRTMPSEDEGRRRAVVRLERMLAKWRDPEMSTETIATKDALGAASADELLTFIRAEFGKP